MEFDVQKFAVRQGYIMGILIGAIAGIPLFFIQ